MPSVIFNPALFKARYPEFATVNDIVLQGCFDEAGMYLSNSDSSPVQNIDRRTILLNMLTAHIAWIGGKRNPGNNPLPVGRVSSATEGSVSAGLEYGAPGSAAWFSQTQYGSSFWQATTALRGFRYRPQPTVY